MRMTGDWKFEVWFDGLRWCARRRGRKEISFADDEQEAIARAKGTASTRVYAGVDSLNQQRGIELKKRGSLDRRFYEVTR